MIRGTRRLSPSWRALLMPCRTAAKIPDRRLRMVAARVTNGVRALRWALEQNRSSRNATSVSSRSESNTARRASLGPYARHSWPALRLSLRKVADCWSVRSPGFSSSAQRAPLNRRAASLSGRWRSLLPDLTANAVQRVTGKLDYVERIETDDRAWRPFTHGFG